MANVLSISSQVAYGHVGNSVTAFVLQRLGHGVWGIPTIILSNRPDYAAFGGSRIVLGVLDEMLEAGLRNGWLDGADAIMTGYLPSAGHVELCARWVSRLKARRPSTIYLCDPVLGDEPGGIYIDHAAAEAVREQLMPLADIATPNRFELGWLTGKAIASLEDAVAAARLLGAKTVLATSSPGLDHASLANVLRDGDTLHATSVTHRQVLAHGTGDFIAAAFMARLLDGQSAPDALSFATAAVEAAITASDNAHELLLIPSQDQWTRPLPAPSYRLRHLEAVPPAP